MRFRRGKFVGGVGHAAGDGAVWEVAAVEGNSLSLSGVCDDRGQHATDTAAAREPCMDRIHVVRKNSRPQNSFPYLTILALRQKAPLWPRLRRRRAGSRRRRETEGVALGRSDFPRRASLAVRYPDWQGNFPELHASHSHATQKISIISYLLFI